MTKPLVWLDGLGVSFGRTPVLTDVSLHLESGTTMGIVGPNGSGKSTLLSVLATFQTPTAGSGSVLGTDLRSRPSPAVRRQIGWVGHDPGLFPELSLLQNLELDASVRGVDLSRADEALSMVGLENAKTRKAKDSSNGMRRRVDLARILMAPPTLLLLDEADAGLDESARKIVHQLLHRTAEAGGASVMVTHDAANLAGKADSVRTLRSGHLE